MLDKKASKIYRKIVCADTDFEAFTIIENLEPRLAKRVLMRYVMNTNKQKKVQ